MLITAVGTVACTVVGYYGQFQLFLEDGQIGP